MLVCDDVMIPEIIDANVTVMQNSIAQPINIFVSTILLIFGICCFIWGVLKEM